VVILKSTSKETAGSASRRAFIQRAGKIGGTAAATTIVLVTMKPSKAAAKYVSNGCSPWDPRC
jgi:hypothetical protein